MNKANLLGLFSVVAIFGAVACSTAAPATSASDDEAVTLKNSHSFRLTASSNTKSDLGISVWHVLTQGETKTVVLEGVDAKGTVKFATSFRQDDDSFRIDSYKAASGKATLTKSGSDYKMSGSTIAAKEWDKYAKAYASDVKNGKATQEYKIPLPSAATVKNLGKTISNGLNNVSNAINVGQAASSAWNWLTGGSSSSSSSSSSGGSSSGGAATSSSSSSGESAGQNENGDDDDTADDDDDGDDDDDTADDDDDGDDDDDTAADDDDGDDDDDTADDDGGELGDEGDVGADESDDSLDEGGDDFGGDEGGDDFGGDEGGDDFGGDDGGGDDFGGDDGGGDDFGGDDGGGDDGGGEEFALHNKCQHLSCSKTTQVCICAKY